MSEKFEGAVVLGSVCSACGAVRKIRNLRYDLEDFMPYCHSPYICNEHHVNSERNLILRKAVKPLVGYDEAKEGYEQYLLSTYDNQVEAERLKRLMLRPTTIRVMDQEMAKYLIRLQDERGLGISEAVRYCIESMMERESDNTKKVVSYVETKKKQEKAAEVVQELEKPKAAVTAASDEGSWAF